MPRARTPFQCHRSELGGGSRWKEKEVTDYVDLVIIDKVKQSGGFGRSEFGEEVGAFGKVFSKRIPVLALVRDERFSVFLC